MSSSLINNNNNNAKRNYVNEKKQINTAEFSKTVMQSALAHLLKSCEKDGEKEGDERKKIIINHFGGIQGVLKASVRELKTINGISEKLATTIYTSIHK